MGCLFVSACAGTALKALSEGRARVGGSVWCCKLTENEAAVGGWVGGGGERTGTMKGPLFLGAATGGSADWSQETFSVN